MNRDEQDRSEPPRVRTEGEADRHVRLSPPTIVLLVVIHDALRRVLAEMLRVYGYEVLAAGSTARAVEKLATERESIDVVVCDVHLPGTGFSVLAASRHEGAEIPVILISADSSPATRRRALELGASRFLPKPVTGQQLHEAIEEISP